MQQSNTTAAAAASATGQDLVDKAPAFWQELDPALQAELEASARSTGALVRRRGVRSALDLLRLVLAYAVCPWSLRQVGAWFHLLGLGHLSDVAVLNRLRGSRAWLGTVLVRLLQAQAVTVPEQPGVRVQLLDATIVATPGQRRQRWYLHTSFDLGRLAVTEVHLTDHHSAESLAHFAAQPDVIGIADRGYAYARSLGAWLAAGAGLIVRAHWQNLPLQDAQGARLDVLAWLRSLPPTSVEHPAERQVLLPTPAGVFPLRLVAATLPGAAQPRALQRVRENAKHKGRRPSPDSLDAAKFMLVLTNLPATHSAAQVLALYRLRWQVELAFKRWKSLFALADVRAHDPDLVQTYLLGNLIAAVLVERLSQDLRQAQSAGFTDPQRPLSLTRLTQLGLECVRQQVLGVIPLARLWAELPNLRRYLCESSRRRSSQASAALQLIRCLSTC